MDIEESILQYVISKKGPSLGQPEIYLEESKEHLTTILEEEKICQLSKQTCNDGFTSAKNPQSDLTHNPCILEVNEKGSTFRMQDNTKLFEFKATSMNIENNFFNVKSENEAPIDQSDVHLEESKELLRPLLEGERICELCKQSCIHGFTLVKDLESDLTQKYPEVNFNPTNEPVMCSSCVDSLNNHKRLLENYSDVQSEIISASDGKDDMFYIKTEEIEIKSEEEDLGSDDEPHEAQASQNHQVTDETLSIHHHPTYKNTSRRQKYQCDVCSYITPRRDHINRHRLKHMDNSEVQVYSCDLCTYVTKHKGNLALHALKHKDISEVKVYGCDLCGFETKYITSLTKHQQRHQHNPKLCMHKCETCNFRTIYKVRLERHQLEHKHGSQAKVYKCDKCQYEGKSARSLKYHQVGHKDISKVQVYSCNSCRYETRHKGLLKSHQLVHEDASNVRMYQCGTCDFQSKYKRTVRNHEMVHRSVSEVSVYACGTCMYVAKFKRYLTQHLLRHDHVSREQM